MLIGVRDSACASMNVLLKIIRTCIHTCERGVHARTHKQYLAANSNEISGYFALLW